MEKRRLGKGGPFVSALGFGCMGISEFYGKPLEKTEAIEVLQAAFQEHNIDFFDTADVYGCGANEELVGEAIRPFRDQIILASKCGIVRNETGMDVNNSPSYIQQACESSLKRLGVETIDLYYLHRPDYETPIEEAMGAMQALLEAGKIRFVGLSEMDSETIQRAHTVLGDKLVAVQTEYSLRVREPAEAVLPTCRELGIAFVAYSPLGRGFLSGRLRDSKQFSQGDAYEYRGALPQFMPGNFEKNLALVDALATLAVQKGCTPVQLVLAWLLAQGADIIPIPGTGKITHLQDNMGAINVMLTTEDLMHIEQIYQENPVAGHRLAERQLKDLRMRA